MAALPRPNRRPSSTRRPRRSTSRRALCEAGGVRDAV
jgi:hypothetical protein